MKVSSQLMEVLRDLIELVGADEVQEIEIERRFFGRGRIRIVRVGQQVPIAQTLAVPAVAAAESAPTEERAAKATDDESSQYYTLKSPMVGMFYQSPNPEAPPYIQAGDDVSVGQTTCIIEAMKIMNEIESDVQGRVVRVLVENASPVEYNTPLFLIDPQK